MPEGPWPCQTALVMEAGVADLSSWAALQPGMLLGSRRGLDMGQLRWLGRKVLELVCIMHDAGFAIM